MAIDLVDVRAKVSPETLVVIKAEAIASDCEMTEVVRSILTEWAAKRRHSNNVLKRLEGGEGSTGSDQGGRYVTHPRRHR